MILGDIQKDGYIRFEIMDEFQLEAWEFCHVDVIILALIDKADEGSSDVTCEIAL